MKKRTFYTEAFYENPELTLEILNKLVEDNHVTEKEMYQSGTFLYLEVSDNEETRQILSQVISDFAAYKNHNNESYISDKTTGIGLCALQDDHCKLYYNDGQEIKWDDRLDGFVFADDLI